MFDQLFDVAPLQELLDWRAATYIILGGALLTIFKSINCFFSGYNLNTELTEKDNKAVAFSFSGFVLGILIVICGVLSNPSDVDSTWVDDLMTTTIWSAIGCIYLLSARVVNDKFILLKFCNTKELAEDRNVGIGAAQAGSYIATALVIKATLTGPDTLSLFQEILLTLIWFTITQALLICFTFVYQIITKYDLHKELQNDNTAAGVALAGNLIAFGLLLAFYISTYDSILGLFVWSAISIILLFIVRIIVDKALLPKQDLDQEIANDHNWGAGMIEAITAIGAALIISGSFS